MEIENVDEIKDILRQENNRYIDTGMNGALAMEEFALAAARKKIESQRYDEAQKRYNEIEQYIKTVCFSEANDLFLKNIADHRRIMASWKGVSDAMNGMNLLLLRALTIGFFNLTSRSIVVADLKNMENSKAQWKVVISSQGFKRRDNIQASDISSGDLIAFLGSDETVNEIKKELATLRNQNALNRFTKLIAILGTEQERKDFLGVITKKSYGLTVPVNPPIAHEADVFDYAKICADDSITFRNSKDTSKYDEGFTIRLNERSYYDQGKVKLRTDVLRTDVPEYFAIYKRIPELTVLFEQKSKSITDRVESVRTQIESLFGAHFLAEVL